MVVAPRVKFRCVHCNRLLSASVDRVGKALACPKCVQAVIVPRIGAGAELDQGPAAQGHLVPKAEMTPSSSAAAPTRREQIPDFMAEIAAAIPDEVLALQPEDIRADVPSLGINFEPTVPPELPIEPAQSEEWLPKPIADADPSTEEAVLPPIHFETDPALTIAADPPVRRTGDVTLPASVVLAWSLFVLFAQGMAFVAGLMVGHYYWR